MSQDDLDDLTRRVDPDRWMSSRFIADPQARADVIALYAFDHELARAPRAASNPILGEIRLTWWREALEEIFTGVPVRRHPGALALAEAVERRGLPQAALEAMVEARYRELDPAAMTAPEALAWARDTAGLCAELAAGLLDPACDPSPARAAGVAWILNRRAGDSRIFHELAVSTLASARRSAPKLSAAAFPAAAHAALAGRAPGSEFSRRLRITWAVARGRI